MPAHSLAHFTSPTVATEALLIITYYLLHEVGGRTYLHAWVALLNCWLPGYLCAQHTPCYYTEVIHTARGHLFERYEGLAGGITTSA